MTILLSGGGTGGHITPILAVAHELKKLHPDCRIVYVGEHKGKFAHIIKGNTDIDETRTIFAGKFRRYHGESRLRRLFDVPTNLLNARDLIYFIIGIIQAWFKLKKIKPDIVFLKGGFVGVPVGIAAHFLKLPFVTHDSDSLPGLANRLAGRWAAWHATGMPVEFYNYPPENTSYVGVLVGEQYQPVGQQLQQSYRQELGLPLKSNLVFITGGSHGAVRLNQAAAKCMPRLLEEWPGLYVVHQVGTGNEQTYGSYSNPRLTVLPFLSNMYRYSGAADVIVTRAGANTLAEFGVQGKACVVAPNPLLTGGHQLKNAEYLQARKAAIIIPETAEQTDSDALYAAITKLLGDEPERQRLGRALQAITPPDASQKIARLLLEKSKHA